MNSAPYAQNVTWPRFQLGTLVGLLEVLFGISVVQGLAADDRKPNADAKPTGFLPADTVQVKAEKPPPVPLHQIAGDGGIFAALSACIVNPPLNGQLVARRSVGFGHVNLGQCRNLIAPTLTELVRKGLEFGYSWNRLGLGGPSLAIKDAPPMSISKNQVQLHNFSVRLQLLKKSQFDQKSVPAVTVGVHYTYNEGLSGINNSLGGALNSAGTKANSGVDFTRDGSKLFNQLPRSVSVQLSGHANNGVCGMAWTGSLPTTVFFLKAMRSYFLHAIWPWQPEYKQQPADYTPIVSSGGALVGEAGDWRTTAAAHAVNTAQTLPGDHVKCSGGLNHEANGVWGITTKWEFWPNTEI